jgi:hypothetical protein
MDGGLYPTETAVQVIIITGLIGGVAAWLAGRAIALTWRPVWHAVGYMLLLGAAVRFAHFALVDADLFWLPAYLADTAFLIAVGFASWRITRAQQMVTQYNWLYERAGPFGWRERAAGGRNQASV